MAADPPSLVLGPLGLAELGAVLLNAFSEKRRHRVLFATGERRAFATDLDAVFVPYPLPEGPDPIRILTCGVALQASPTKELAAGIALTLRRTRERNALLVAEGRAALGWVREQWPGLAGDFEMLAPGHDPEPVPRSATELWERASKLAAQPDTWQVPFVFGRLVGGAPGTNSRLWTSLREVRGRLNWGRRGTSPRFKLTESLPVSGSGGYRDQRARAVGTDDNPDPPENVSSAGIPYDEWDTWRGIYRRNFVMVYESVTPAVGTDAEPLELSVIDWIRNSPDRTWSRRRHAGSDIDVDAYVEQVALTAAGIPQDPAVYMDLARAPRDLATAILVDASSSLHASAGSLMALQLQYARALSLALSSAREAHAVFTFSSQGRQRVDMRVLRDFNEERALPVLAGGLRPGGYTRLGAAIRHSAVRLIQVPAARRVLLALGDGLPSDEAYEGTYAVEDVVKAVEEALSAGIAFAYIGLGDARSDPLGAALGRHLVRVSDLGGLGPVLADVHQELCA